MRSGPYVTPETLVPRTQAWLAAIRSRVAPRPRLQLDPQRAVLVVIDMLRYFADPAGRCHLPATRAVIPQIAALLTAWRAGGHPVVFTRHGHRDETDLGMLGRFFDDYIRADEPEAEIISALQPAPGEPVIRKTTYDAFLGTSLGEFLEETGRDQLLISGVLTHMCCETSARAGFCRGYEVFVAADAMATSSEDLHLGSLLAMADAVAIVMTTEEVLARCRAQM
ncbi:MAG: cysteine hydrolase [Candidatus Eisenbacteria sp.]|nr:cysteine hydrolase [Candidatus Eisenbacteria bacterium]